MIKLKKCPFCNNEASIWSRLGGYIIECDNENCGCSYGNSMSLDFDEVIKMWNMRGERE